MKKLLFINSVLTTLLLTSCGINGISSSTSVSPTSSVTSTELSVPTVTTPTVTTPSEDDVTPSDSTTIDSTPISLSESELLAKLNEYKLSIKKENSYKFTIETNATISTLAMGLPITMMNTDSIATTYVNLTEQYGYNSIDQSGNMLGEQHLIKETHWLYNNNGVYRDLFVDHNNSSNNLDVTMTKADFEESFNNSYNTTSAIPERLLDETIKLIEGGSLTDLESTLIGDELLISGTATINDAALGEGSLEFVYAYIDGMINIYENTLEAEVVVEGQTLLTQTQVNGAAVYNKPVDNMPTI